jgi:hypothetical protein
MKNMLFL